jgi:DNA helicase-2/ATP-dependent DNA helicase PcrA
MPAAYLEKLNPEQRRAVEHGVREYACAPAGPLLVIAGAGSGKTNTLAHRVAHFIVNGADPRRILLMTFSRRAAGEMTRRVERICSQALGANAGIMTGALSWAGTFHGIGARLLRDYAEQIGLDPGFTIHDREDSADLMNLVRHQLGLSKTESRFPAKGTCLAIYSRAVNAELPLGDVLGGIYPWCAGWEKQLRELFALYVEAKQTQNVLDYDDLLLYWAQTMGDPRLADDMGGRFRSRSRRRISGHQPASGVDPVGAEAGWPGPHGRWRRCAVDLFVPRGDRAQHSRLSERVQSGGRHHYARP